MLKNDQSTAERAGIRSVSYQVAPKKGGSASRSVSADGAVSGHHMSGGSGAPFVTMEQGRVSQDCIDEVWDLAEQIMKTTAGQPSFSQEAGTATISIAASGNRNVTVSWPSRGEPTDANVRKLLQLLRAMEIGYW